MALCFGPIFISVWRWRREFVEKESKSAAVWSSKPPVEERLSKIYSPQWGMTEVKIIYMYIYTDSLCCGVATHI